MTRGTLWTGLALALGLAALVRVPADAQGTRPRTLPTVIPSMYGRDLFDFYCATCHGRDGKGRGPAAAALKAEPADLTGISARNGGTFPRARVTALVTGDSLVPMEAHGSKDMPVWGPIFRALSSDEAATRVRIANIVEYLESLQAKP